MSPLQQHLEAGDFQQALRVLEEQLRTGASSADTFLMAFNLRLRLEEYDAALAALDDFARVRPDLAEGAVFLRECAQAERTRASRRTDPAAAGKRASLKPPEPFSRAWLQASVLHARGQYAEAATVLEQAARAAPTVAGTLVRTNGAQVRFTNLTDSDDLTGPHLSCSEGSAVLDVPYAELRSVRFSQPRTFMDFSWLPALLETREGEKLEVRVFSLYAGSWRHEEPTVRLGKLTLWEHEHGYAEAAGQRDFKLTTPDGGMAMVGLLQVARIEFDEPAQARSEAPKSEQPRPEARKGFWSKLFG